jgi:hypothetical protein
MDTTDIKQQVIIFEKSRNNLLSVIIFTVINLILTYFDASVNFLFSATLPQFILEIGKAMNSEMESNVLIIVGLIIAFIIIIPYFIFWILARRVRVLILVALIFFSIDSLLLLYLIFNTEFNFSVLLEIAFHVWILYYLINGVKAWYKLRSINTEVFNTILLEIKPNNISSTKPSVSDMSNKEINEDNNLNNE